MSAPNALKAQRFDLATLEWLTSPIIKIFLDFKTSAFSVDISFNSLEVLNNKSLWISPRDSTLEEKDLIQTTRIGISKAKNIKWRWYLKNSRSVSKRLKGDRTPKFQ